MYGDFEKTLTMYGYLEKTADTKKEWGRKEDSSYQEYIGTQRRQFTLGIYGAKRRQFTLKIYGGLEKTVYTDNVWQSTDDS